MDFGWAGGSQMEGHTRSGLFVDYEVVLQGSGFEPGVGFLVRV